MAGKGHYTLLLPYVFAVWFTEAPGVYLSQTGTVEQDHRQHCTVVTGAGIC